MLDQLQLNNFPSGYDPEASEHPQCFILKTCQRTLVLGHGTTNFINNVEKITENFTGTEAYSYLLHIICGLKSKLVGENEIVGQFKQAYIDYSSGDHKNTHLLMILEKLFKDSKEIRSKYLLGLSQKTYSSITRRHIVNKNGAQEVLILGSGQLAEDLINQFKKKIKVFISARNIDRVKELSEMHNIKVIPWKDFDTYAKFPFIANSIGCKNNQFIGEEFFKNWSILNSKKLFVDLGSPSVLNTELTFSDGVMRLKEIFDEGAVHETHKRKKIEDARIAMEGIVDKRHSIFKKKAQNNEIYNRK